MKTTKRYVSLCTLVLMAVCTFTMAQDENSTRTALTAPKIVASGVFQHQSAAIAPMTILTPSTAGLYRVSLYIGITNEQSDNSGWHAQIETTDGPSDRPMTVDAFTVLNALPNGAFGFGILSPRPGTPIAVQVQATTLNTPVGFYTVRYVIEQLQ